MDGNQGAARNLLLRATGRKWQYGIAMAVLAVGIISSSVLCTAAPQFLEMEATWYPWGAGAAGLAALLAHPQHFTGRKVGLVLCGGNIDTRLLASVLLRGLVRDGRIVP